MKLKTFVLAAAIALVISGSLYLRSLPYFKYSAYGVWLQYDDSMFEYWLSKTLYKNGLTYWYQLTPENTRELWWWPQGRDIRKTETPGLAFTGAGLYPLMKVLGLRMVDWVGLIPAFYGTLAVSASALLGTVVGGPLLGLIMSLSTAYQYAFIQRSIASFVEKMAPCMFFGTLYLATLSYFLRKKNSMSTRSTVFLGVLGGIALMLSAAFWGGFLMFVGITTLLVMLLPYLTSDENGFKKLALYLVASTLTFYATSLWITTFWMHRIWTFALLVFLSTFIYLGAGLFVTKRFRERALKYWTALLIISVLALALVVSHPYVLHRFLTGRYIMMLMPWLRRVENPLARSVAEHQGIFDVYTFNDLVNVLGIGLAAPVALAIAFYKFKQEKDELIATLPIIALGLFATYILFANTSVYLLTPIGYLTALAGALALFWSIEEATKSKPPLKVMWIGIALILLVLLISGSLNGINFAINYPPPSYLSAGTAFYSPLFPESMKEIAKYCDYVLAWWDYGYMIGVMGNATTAVDPATLNTTKIQLVAKGLIGNENDVIDVLKKLDMLTPRTCVFTYEVFPLAKRNTVILVPQAGDFAKSVWMFRIAGYEDATIFSKYIRISYVVVGEANGKEVAIVVRSPNDIQATPQGIVVRTPEGRIILLNKVKSITPTPSYNVNNVFIYKAIYSSLKKAGYEVINPLGRPIVADTTFQHFEVMSITAPLYTPDTHREIPWIAVTALLRYSG